MGRKIIQPWLKLNYKKDQNGTQRRKLIAKNQLIVTQLRAQSNKFFQKKDVSGVNKPADPVLKEGISTENQNPSTNPDTHGISNEQINYDVQEATINKDANEEMEKRNEISEEHKLIEKDHNENLIVEPDLLAEPKNVILDLSDPMSWPVILTDSSRTSALIKGPLQKKLKYHDSTIGKFNRKYFTGRKKNGETFHRKWLMYSESTNSLFCFPCCIHKDSNSAPTPWSNYGSDGMGYNNFHDTLRGITRHESSYSHLENSRRWIQFIYEYEKGAQINSGNQKLFKEMESSWKSILKGILEAVLFLAENNLSFRGSNNVIGEYGAGNFLNLIQLLSKFYPPLTKHVSNLKKGQTNYLSPLIQNEFITICGNHAREKILENIRDRKYFSIMFDATPDASHKEQVCQIIRTVHCSKSGCSIEENFIDFVTSNDKKGEDIALLITNKLTTDKLDLNNCRGQSYDNCSNMSGKYKGVQKRIIDKNPLAKFVPCAAHSLNLVGVNAAENVLSAKLLLGQIQSLYNFFVRSPKRWSLVNDKLKCNLKGESETRWSARSDAVSAVSQQYESVLEMLITIMVSKDHTSETIAGANSLYNSIFNFKFLLGLTIWEHVLFRFQICNNILQQKDLNIDCAEKSLSKLLDWLNDFRKTGFDLCYKKAIEKAEFIDLDPNSGFDNVRVTRGKKRKRLGELCEDLILTNEKKFEVEFFNELLDSLIAEVNSRFVQIRECNQIFSFLWGNELFTITNEKIEQKVKKICKMYDSDFSLTQFVLEAQALKSEVFSSLEANGNPDSVGPFDVLNMLHKTGMVESFVNVDIALRIFLTMPITVASNERAFSKLKLLKNYLRSAMGQERLTNLAILSIEHEITKMIDFDVIISKFASSKVRKVPIF